MVASAGVSMSHMLVSDTTQTSAASSALWSRTNGSRLGLPDSSSPSRNTVTRIGKVPCTSCQARIASSQVMTWPLSSTAPRATMRGPCSASTMVGSNGGLRQRSSGSTGWTS
jgi:hypothetical protein